MERNLFAQGTAPYLFEDSGINKFGDTYYYSYGSNFDECNGPIFKVALRKREITEGLIHTTVPCDKSIGTQPVFNVFKGIDFALG